MPIHSNITIDQLVPEIRRLEEAGMVVRFVVPQLIEHKPGNMFGVIIQYAIIFDAP